MSVFRLFGRKRRRWVPWSQIVALLFMQFAVASYVCPAVAAATLATMADCGEHGRANVDPVQPQLCKAHCIVGDQAIDATHSPDAAAALALLAVLDWRALPSLALAGPRRGFAPRSGAPPPGAPPLYLSLLVLRR